MDTQSEPIQEGSEPKMPPVHIDDGIPAQKQSNNLAVPAAIVIAGALVAFAIYQKNPAPTQKVAPPSQAAVAGGAANLALKPVFSGDHIRGNLDAPVKIVEYSDMECPFCKRFHSTLEQVINEYGKDGQVAWVYRHLPLESLHSKASKEAEATECANKLGGNEKFWAYLDKVFEITPSNNGLDPAFLPKIAEDIGLDRTQFEQCLFSGEFTKLVSDSIAEATNAGAQGTPFSIVISKSGKKYPINGALPYQSVKQTIDLALSDK